MKVCHWFSGLRAGAAALTASLFLATSADAALLVYEPFDYPTGTIFATDVAVSTVASNTPGIDQGWTEQWRSNGNASVSQTSVTAGSLSYSVGGRTLVTKGNKFWTTGNSTSTGDSASNAFTSPGGTASASPYRRIALANQRGYSTVDNSVTWISYLGQAANLQTLPFNGVAAEPPGVINYGRAVGGAQLFNSAADNTGTNTAAGTEHLSFGRASQDSETSNGNATTGTTMGLTNDTWGAVVGGTGRGTVASTDTVNHHLTDLVMYLVKITHRAGIDTA
jgi:hypothetical protein